MIFPKAYVADNELKITIPTKDDDDLKQQKPERKSVF